MLIFLFLNDHELILNFLEYNLSICMDTFLKVNTILLYVVYFYTYISYETSENKRV